MRLVAVTRGIIVDGRRWLLAIVLTGAVLVPAKASAQEEFYQQQCVSSFLAACATLHFIDFSETWGGGSKGILRLIVSNTSNAGAEANAYIYQLIFDLTGTVPDVQALAAVEYGDYTDGVFTGNGDKENWKVKKTNKGPKEAPEGFQIDLQVKDKAKAEDGGDGGLGVNPGDAVMIVIKFEDLLTGVGLGCEDPVNCQAWSAELKGLGADGTGKGFTTTTTPEPTTLFLLLTGLLGIAGGRALRRRRGDPIEGDAID